MYLMYCAVLYCSGYFKVHYLGGKEYIHLDDVLRRTVLLWVLYCKYLGGKEYIHVVDVLRRTVLL